MDFDGGLDAADYAGGLITPLVLAAASKAGETQTITVKDKEVRGRARVKKKAKQKIPASSWGDVDPVDESAQAEIAGGRLQPIAAKVLMNILYAARMARFDLLKAVCHLACHITRWTSQCDRRIHRIICYINSTLDLRTTG